MDTTAGSGKRTLYFSAVQSANVFHRDLVRNDILQAIQSTKGELNLHLADYCFNDRTLKKLLRLYGTVAIQYGRSRYNIPIEIWLQEEHPIEAPLVYVKPTSNMFICPTLQVVQADGRVVLSYLTLRNSSSNNLTTLPENLSASFSQSPPVYSMDSRHHASLPCSEPSPHRLASLTNVPMPSSDHLSPLPYPSMALSHRLTSLTNFPMPSTDRLSSYRSMPFPCPSTVKPSRSNTSLPTTNEPISSVKYNQRFYDIDEEPRRMLSPIQGFERMPLVSLEKAVIPIVSLIPNIKEMVWSAKQRCSDPKDGLSSDESASIMLYTKQWQPYEKSVYVILNIALRATSRIELEPWFLYLRLIIHALQKLPSTHHVVYRGVKADLTNEYWRDNIVTWWGFSSCTASIETLKNEQFLGKSGIRTLFSIECDSGKNIRSHSFHPGEDEVLLLPARQFKMIGCLNQGDELHIIQLRETQPIFPLIKLNAS